jgi:predicted RNA binding protein YcfA (HicA-like mRNA interferase family)
MKHAIKIEQITVPFHARKEVKKELLRSILKQAGIKTGKR